MLPNATITLTFEANGELGGRGGCNSYGGDYKVQGDTLVVGEIVSTLMACANQALTDQEQRYLSALRAAGQFAITADTLIVQYEGGSGALTFARAAASATSVAATASPLPGSATPMVPVTPAAQGNGAPGPQDATRITFGAGETSAEINASIAERNVVPWPVINQFLCIVGGCLWGTAALVYRRATRGACAYCGRSDTTTGWTTPAAAARWGKWAVYVAVVIPILYALTRFAWALGLPLGISEAFLRQGQAVGLWWAGAALAMLAVAGGALTLGLIQPWGEIFPRWMPWIGGRRVPIALAVIPAALVTILVTTAGLMFARLMILGNVLQTVLSLELDLAENWAAVAPELLWPLWGAALGAATLAYYYRRRARCPHCGRG